MGNSVQRTGTDADFSAENGDGISNESYSEKGETTNFIQPFSSSTIEDAYYCLKDELKQVSTTNKFILKRLNEQQQWMQSLTKERLEEDSKTSQKADGDIVAKDDKAGAESDMFEMVIAEFQLREKNRGNELTMMKHVLKTILQKLDRVIEMSSAEAEQPDVERNEEIESWFESVDDFEEDEIILIEKEDSVGDDSGDKNSQNRNPVLTHEKEKCDKEEMVKKGMEGMQSTSSSDHVTSHQLPPGDKMIPDTLELPVKDGFDLTDEQSDFGIKLHRARTVPSQDNRIAFSYDLKSLQGFVMDQTEKAGNGSKSIMKSVDSSMRSEVQVDAVKNESEQTSPKAVRFTDTELNVTAPSASKKKTGSVKSEEVATIISDEMWTAWARQECVTAQSSSYPRGEGIFTVLLLDISASMSGCMKQMKDTVKEFLNGVEKVAIDDSLEENVAIATFGQETRVIQHLTNNYALLRNAVDTLTSGGRSPLFAGLMMAVSAFIDLKTVGPGLSPPRVIVFTDGRITGSQKVKGPDNPTGENPAVVKAKIVKFCKTMSKKQVKIHCVPVPVNDYEKSLMTAVTEATKGKIVLGNDIRKLSRTFHNCVILEKVMKTLTADGHAVEVDFIRATQNYPGTTVEDVEDMFHMITERSSTDNDLEENKYQETVDPTMLPLGTRVRRGPDWSWGDQDKNTAGTVIGHEADGWIWVHWDVANCIENRYHYGANQLYDVVAVDEPRLLKDELIAVGCLVKRGKDWANGDEDGGEGSIGVILKVNANGIIQVRWPSHRQGEFRFGFEGRFELDLCDPAEVQDTVLALGGATAGGEIAAEAKTKVEKLRESVDEKQLSKSTLTIEEMNRRNAERSINIPTPGQIIIPIELNQKTEPGTAEGKGAESVERIITMEPVAEKSDKKTEGGVISVGSGDSKIIGHNENDLHLVQRETVPTIPMNFPDIRQQCTSRTPEKSTGLQVHDTESSSDTSRASSPSLMGASTRRKVEWNWMDASGNWQSYSADVTKDIEKAYAKRPNSTKIIRLNGEVYRVIFTTMQQVNTASRQIHGIKRIVITDE